jgi:hypothetical protein
MWIPLLGDVQGLPWMETSGSHTMPLPVKARGWNPLTEADKAIAQFYDFTLNLQFPSPGKYKIRAAWLSTMLDTNRDPNFFEGDIHSNDLIVQVAPSP